MGRPTLTKSDLRELDGESSLQLGLALGGRVYDVSGRPDLYGKRQPGPPAGHSGGAVSLHRGGAYSHFVGEVCTRSFAKTSLEREHIGRSDIADLGPENFKALKEWIDKFDKTYESLGEIDEQVPAAEGWRDRESLLRLLEEKLGPADAGGGGNSSAGGGTGGRGEGGARDGDAGEAPAAGPRGPRVPRWTCLSVPSASTPAAYTIEDFVSPAECERLKEMMLTAHEGRSFSTKLRVGLAPSKFHREEQSHDRKLLEDLEERIGRLCSCPPHDGETEFVGMLTTPDKEGPGAGDMHIGVHVDVNRRPYRYATCIIYLSDVEEGGETVFLRDSDETRLLLENGILHTDMVPMAWEKGERAAAMSASAWRDSGGSARARAMLRRLTPDIVGHGGHSGTDHGERLLERLRSDPKLQASLTDAKQYVLSTKNASLMVRPKAGMCLLFWSRDARGRVCSSSYHGGRAVRSGFKFTLQKFKELPRELLDAVASPGEVGQFVEESLRSVHRASA